MSAINLQFPYLGTYGKWVSERGLKMSFEQPYPNSIILTSSESGANYLGKPNASFMNAYTIDIPVPPPLHVSSVIAQKVRYNPAGDIQWSLSNAMREFSMCTTFVQKREKKSNGEFIEVLRCLHPPTPSALILTYCDDDNSLVYLNDDLFGYLEIVIPDNERIPSNVAIIHHPVFTDDLKADEELFRIKTTCRKVDGKCYIATPFGNFALY